MFGQRLNATRKSKGFTAKAMADELQIALRSYRMYESGDRFPSLDMLVKIADTLDVPTDYLLCRDDFMNSRGVSADVFPINLPNRPTE